MAMADASGQNYVKEDTWLDRGCTIKTTTYQYLDGLGRKSQTATNAINTSGNYVHSLQTYDTNGRLSSQWLPAVGTSIPGCLSASAFGSCSQSTYGDSYAYTTKHYDALGSVTAIDEAGNAWHTEGKQTQTTYDTNVAGEVRLYTATATGSLAKNGFHPEESLTKISTTDADGRTAITYKDFLGRTVLERQTSNRDSLDTYYVYNERGQLGFVLSPGYQESGKKAIYGYGYIYDSHGRLTKKNLPQSEYTQYWYDSEGRLTGEQTQMMRERNLRRFFLYEEYGRVAVQGLCGAQQDFPSHTVTFSTTGNSLFGSGYAVASNGTVTNPMLESVSYYDEYFYIYTPLFATIGSFADSIRVNDSRFGQMTGRVECCSNGQLFFSGFAYDHRKNLICKTEALGDRTLLVTRTERSFTGKPQFTYSTLTSNGVTTTANSEYVLADSSDLTVSVKMTVNGGTSVTISDFTYDDLGRVVRNTRGGNAGYVAYDYNLRGWINEIDGTGFHEWLYYTDGNNTPYYSGNISSQYWKVSGENFKRRYWYGYDKFGRMYRALYADMGDTKRDYSEYLSEYKANGNFRRLKRYGKKAQGNYGKIDNLHLYFDYNRLKSVREDALPTNSSTAMEFIGSDTTTNAAIQYGYYDDGSLKWDSNKGIAHILYTPQGYPVRVQFKDGHTTEYVYTSDGRRMCTVHRTAVPNITVAMGDTLHLDATNTLSCDTTEYFGDFVFEDGQLSKYLFDGGYCTFTSATGQPTYHYFTCDHQGNVRAVVRQDGTIEQINHYYPLGGIFADGSTNDSFQKYKYNGKELDRMHGLNFYDYGARQYDPILGRFTQMDPMCEKYYNFHPYAYCMNNPINAIDLEGKYTEVINKGNNTDQVVGGVPNNDLNVYIVDNDYLRRTGEIIGKTISAYSFMDNTGRPMVGATIDLGDTSGQSFWNEFVSNTPNIITYMLNATEYHYYDFKNNGILRGANQYDAELYHYRGMKIAVNGVNYISSARDIGNMAAGYIAAKNGLSWKESRFGFDFLESFQNLRPSTEGQPTQRAQKFGYDAYSNYWEILTNWFNTYNIF